MKRFFVVLGVVMLLCPLAMWAVPARPVKKVLTLVDGSQVEATLMGDEHFSCYRAADGRSFRAVGGDRYVEMGHFELQARKAEAVQSVRRANARRHDRVQRRVGAVQGGLTGSKRGLVILVYYQDQQFVTPEPQKVFNHLFNEKGLKDYGMNGSVSDYFAAQSYGQFDLEFDVVGPYKLSKNRAAYGGAVDSRHDADPWGMAAEAVQLASRNVDFTPYDWNEDGEVDQVFIIYAGQGEHHGASSDCVWAHESSIRDYNLKFNGKRIATYGCSCEVQGTSGTTLEGIGTACHEFSHCLGFPDMYDTGGSGNYAMSQWDIMASGSYNTLQAGMSGTCPAGYTSYERWMAGWLTPKEVTSATEVEDMPALVDAPEAYVLYNEKKRDEYYLLENRQKKGFDAGLPGHGLLVVHADYDATLWATNAVNQEENHQRMTIIPADGGLYNTQDELAGDPFPGRQRVTALTDASAPAATLYNENTNGRRLMGKPVEFITESVDGKVSFLVSSQEVVSPVLTVGSLKNGGVDVAWTADAQAKDYRVQLIELPQRKTAKESVVLKETFAKAFRSSRGIKDIANRLETYSDNGLKFTGEGLYQSPGNLLFGAFGGKGSLLSPEQKAPKMGAVTMVLSISPSATSSKATITLSTKDEGSMSYSVNLTEKTQVVLYASRLLTTDYQVGIATESGLYLDGLTVYDGLFTPEELELKGLIMKSQMPAFEMRHYGDEVRTAETSHRFEGLSPTSEYEVRVRMVGEGEHSPWSVPVRVSGTTDVKSLVDTASSSDQLYDLQGRRLTTLPAHGIYLRGGKKVLR